MMPECRKFFEKAVMIGVAQIVREKYVKTMIGEIEKTFPKKIHAININSYLLKIAQFLFTFQIDMAFIR